MKVDSNRNQYAILGHSKYGPSFGFDIFIANNSNTTMDSRSNFFFIEIVNKKNINKQYPLSTKKYLKQNEVKQNEVEHIGTANESGIEDDFSQANSSVDSSETVGYSYFFDHAFFKCKQS